jgi:hypothetical protein
MGLQCELNPVLVVLVHSPHTCDTSLFTPQAARLLPPKTDSNKHIHTHLIIYMSPNTLCDEGLD